MYSDTVTHQLCILIQSIMYSDTDVVDVDDDGDIDDDDINL